MIVTEHYKMLDDGTVLNRTYSDCGMYIEREGVLYGDAIDIAAFGYQYNETGIPLEIEEE